MKVISEAADPNPRVSRQQSTSRRCTLVGMIMRYFARGDQNLQVRSLMTCEKVVFLGTNQLSTLGREHQCYSRVVLCT